MPSASGSGAARFDGHCDGLSQKRDREAAMTDQGAQSPAMDEVVSLRPGCAWARKPSVLVPLVVAIVVAGAVVPWLLGYTSNGQQAIDQRIDPEDGALCAQFGFAPGPNSHSDCKAALVDLRRRRAPLLLY